MAVSFDTVTVLREGAVVKTHVGVAEEMQAEEEFCCHDAAHAGECHCLRCGLVQASFFELFLNLVVRDVETVFVMDEIGRERFGALDLSSLIGCFRSSVDDDMLDVRELLIADHHILIEFIVVISVVLVSVFFGPGVG